MIDLNTFARGELRAKLNDAFRRVADNIQNENTAAEEKRTITVNLKFTPGEDRKLAGVAIDVKTKLADAEPAVTQIFIKDDGGQLQIAEIGNQIPGQMSMYDFDSETGEIKEAEE